MKLRMYTLIVSLSLALVNCASLDNMDDDEKYEYGITHLKSNKGVLAIESCAADGHGGCAQVLGDLYYKGQGVERDLEQARKWQLEAMKSDYNYRFSGIFGALALANYYCEEPYYKAGSEKILELLENTQELITIYLGNLSENSRKEVTTTTNRISDEINRLKQKVTKGGCVNR